MEAEHHRENATADARKGTAKPLRILLVLPEFPPAIGGMQTHARYLSEHLHNQGHTVRVYTYQGASPFRQGEAERTDAEMDGCYQKKGA